MKHKFKILFPVVGLLLVIHAGAQEKKTITLWEAVDLSIKNSHQLKSDKAKIEEATAALKESVEKRLPSATVSGSYLRLNSANFEMKTKDSSGGSGGSGSPKVSQAAYGLLNISLPI